MQKNTPLSDSVVTDIFTNLRAERVSEVFDNNSLHNIHEVLVSVFMSDSWKKPSLYQKRCEFLAAIGELDAQPADHKAVFKAMAEAHNSHGVFGYLQMLGVKERVFLKDHSALIATHELAQMYRSQGSRMGNVSHFLSRAVCAGLPGSVRTLWRETADAFDPGEKFKERVQEGMQTLVRRFGLQMLGLGKNDMDNKPWIEKFFQADDERTQGIASAIIAAQMSKKHISKEELIDGARDFTSKMRLVNSLGFQMEDFGVKGLIRSHASPKPSYKIDYQLTL